MARNRSYRQIAKRQRARLFHEQGGLCFYCQQPMLLMDGRPDGRVLPRQITLDHIIPQAHGGPKAPTKNTVAACHECNNQRGTKEARKFLSEKRGSLA